MGPRQLKGWRAKLLEKIGQSLKAKKKKLSSQMEVMIFSSPRAKQKLKMETNEHEDNEIGELEMEDLILISLEAGHQLLCKFY